MRLMDYHGTLYMMSKGPEAMKLLNKAISLDKKNFAVFNSLATYYLNAPAIGGGSVVKGIEAGIYLMNIGLNGMCRGTAISKGW